MRRRASRARSVGVTELGNRALALAIGTVALLAPGAAQAQEECQPSDGLSTCFSSDNLWPQHATGNWLSIAPATATPDGSVSVGFVTGYLHRPVGLRIASPDPEGTTIYAVEHVVPATFLSSVGVSERLSIDLAMPVVLFQDGATKADIIGSDDVLPRSAIGDFRFGPTFTVVPREGDQGPAFALRFSMVAPTGNPDAFVGAATATYAPGFSYDHRIDRFSFGVDAAGRIRDPVKFGGAVLGPQIALALGAAYDIMDDGILSAGLEAFALFTTHTQLDIVSEPGDLTPDERVSDRPHIPIEWALSVHNDHLLERRLHLHVAGGSFIPTGDGTGVTVPTFRLQAAIGYRYE